MVNSTVIYVNEIVDGEMIVNDYHQVLLKDVKKGEFFTVKAGAKNKYVKGDYCRINKAFDCSAWINGSDKSLKGSKIVYVGFTY